MIRIPRGFYEEHTIGLCLPAPPVVKETKRNVWIDENHPDFSELKNNAELYCHPYGPEYGPWTIMARAFLKAIEGVKS